jgi:hypothetical protein
MLPNDWKILVMHGTDNMEFVVQILSKLPMDRFLPCIQMEVSNLNLRQYNMMLMCSPFYEKIPTERMLVFQTDSIILEPDKLDAFLKYDYVGAPWKDGKVGNGGLSLRKKSKMLEICRRGPLPENEDIYFCVCHGGSLYRPRAEEAKQFSVETIFYDRPFGIHAPWKWLSGEEMTVLIKRYPAIQTLIDLQRTDAV